MNDRTKNQFPDVLTLISIGTMAYVFADLFHEAIGHGATSLILGNKITLLTSVYFRSETHSFITDAFGPITNLVAGLIIWIALKKANFTNLYLRLLFVLTMFFNFCWFSWMCLYSGITNKGDLAFYIEGQTELLVWRISLIVFGLLSYYLFYKLTSRRIAFKNVSGIFTSGQIFSIPYLSAGVSALIAVSFYRPLSPDNFYEAIVFPMFLPTLFLVRQIRHNDPVDKKYSFRSQKHLIISGLILFILFCLTMGQGLKQ